jgi:hypothetical protein
MLSSTPRARASAVVDTAAAPRARVVAHGGGELAAQDREPLDAAAFDVADRGPPEPVAEPRAVRLPATPTGN